MNWRITSCFSYSQILHTFISSCYASFFWLNLPTKCLHKPTRGGDRLPCPPGKYAYVHIHLKYKGEYGMFLFFFAFCAIKWNSLITSSAGEWQPQQTNGHVTYYFLLKQYREVTIECSKAIKQIANAVWMGIRHRYFLW